MRERVGECGVFDVKCKGNELSRTGKANEANEATGDGRKMDRSEDDGSNERTCGGKVDVSVPKTETRC